MVNAQPMGYRGVGGWGPHCMLYVLLHFNYDCFAVVGGWVDGSLARALLRLLFYWVLKTGRCVHAICTIVGMLL